MKYEIKAFSDYGTVNVKENTVVFQSDKDYKEAFFGARFDFADWEEDAFILMPACAYNGNRFRRTGRYGYPIAYNESEMGVDAEPVIPEVPALNPDGSGTIEVTAGDLAVPCVGIFYRNAKKGLLLYTEQAVKDRNIGFTVKQGSIELSFPANRRRAYRWSKEFAENVDKGISVSAGEELASRFLVFTFACESMDAFFEKFFDTRKSLMRGGRTPNMYTKKLWGVLENHFNEDLWSGEYYNSSLSRNWNPGWCGEAMHTYPLLLHGDALTRQRAEQSIDFLVAHQSPAGFYYGYNQEKKAEMDDSRMGVAANGMHLVRRSGDVLGYLIKHIRHNSKATWIESAEKCADGLCGTFERFGTFGQYVCPVSGDVLVGASAAGASAVGSLVHAWAYFGRDRYLAVAKASGEFYYRNFISQGISSGAIGDAVCSPDSESIAAFIESYVLLYEATKEEKWLACAKAATHILASWVVTYRYRFPEGSEFHRLGINTVGSVFANIQNKHSAPGLCTSSGEYIYKLYQYTGDERYRELILDIVSALPQSVSTEERPIYATMSPYGGVALEEPVKMPAGYISERVNMSDWEGFIGVGSVFPATCWCASSVLLTYSDLIWKYGLDW